MEINVGIIISNVRHDGKRKIPDDDYACMSYYCRSFSNRRRIYIYRAKIERREQSVDRLLDEIMI